MEDWIEISDKLPEEGIEVLAYCSTDIVQAYLYKGIWKGSLLVTDNMNDGFVNDRTICKQGGFFDYVTHWMPLAEPPNQ